MNASASVVIQPRQATERVWLYNHKSNGLKAGSEAERRTHIAVKSLKRRGFQAAGPDINPLFWPTRDACAGFAPAKLLTSNENSLITSGKCSYVKLARSLQDASACPTFALSPPGLPIVRQRVSGSSQGPS